eukprot:gene55883-25002_t
MKSVCPYEAGNKVVAIRTFETDSTIELRKTVDVGTMGVVDHVSEDSDGHPQDVYVQFDGIEKAQW